jgi:hypothetical protein
VGGLKAEQAHKKDICSSSPCRGGNADDMNASSPRPLRPPLTQKSRLMMDLG